MAENKLITELSGITNPSLTGYTIYDDGNTTYKLELGELVAYVSTAEGDFVTTASFNTYTSSVTQMMVSLNPVLSSLQTSTSSLNAFTSSINTKTGSFAITGSNTFIGNQTIRGSVIIGSGSLHNPNPEILSVYNSGSFNIAYFTGDSDTYAQINIQNTSDNSGASSDLVLTADNGSETNHYVNLGINSSGWLYQTASIGYQNDAYLYNVGQDLYIGTMEPASPDHGHLHLFASNSWENPQITIFSEKTIAFNTDSVTTGYTYEFSGSVKLQDELKIDGSVTASYFVGDGSQLINLPLQTNWNVGKTYVIRDSEQLTFSGDYVLDECSLIIENSEEDVQYTQDKYFQRKGSIFIGGNLLVKDSHIQNDGIISVGGELILMGDSIITGSGIII